MTFTIRQQTSDDLSIYSTIRKNKQGKIVIWDKMKVNESLEIDSPIV
jgi:hypothetical protein